MLLKVGMHVILDNMNVQVSMQQSPRQGKVLLCTAWRMSCCTVRHQAQAYPGALFCCRWAQR